MWYFYPSNYSDNGASTYVISVLFSLVIREIVWYSWVLATSQTWEQVRRSFLRFIIFVIGEWFGILGSSNYILRWWGKCVGNFWGLLSLWSGNGLVFLDLTTRPIYSDDGASTRVISKVFYLYDRGNDLITWILGTSQMMEQVPIIVLREVLWYSWILATIVAWWSEHV